MIGISGLGRASLSRGARAAGTVVAGGFSVPASPSALAGAPAGASGPVGAIGLIALQEDDRPYVKDRAAQRGGERVLAALDRLGRAGLDDPSAPSGQEALAALGQAVGQMTEPHDPILRGLIGAIRLRARVELARRDLM